jgi:hypothetical protein
MYLICVDQLAKIGHHALVMKKKRIFWISGIDHHINGLNVLSIELSPKRMTAGGRLQFDARSFIQRLKLCPEFDGFEYSSSKRKT